MLREVKELHGVTLHALNGEVGRIDEILFDDEYWTVRYLIVDTGGWLFGRKVLISPLAFGLMDWDQKMLHVNLTRAQIEQSPDVITDEPVSRQWEKNYYDFYSLPYYWDGMGGWGAYWSPGMFLAQTVGTVETPQEQAADKVRDHASAHLRSTKAVIGYKISATDGHIGHVQDFIVDDETWHICYLAVDTQDRWHGKKVLLPPDWIGEMNWPDGNVTVSVTHTQVRNAPEWDHSQPITRTYEEQLYSYYNRLRPWDHDQSKSAALESSEYRTPQEKQMSASEQTELLEKSAVVAVYDTHTEAETAIRELQKLGFDMTKLSLIGKDYQINEKVIGYYTTGDRMKSWGATGAFWGGMWSLLFGSAFFLVPGIGALLAAGPVVAWIVGALESAAVVGGMSVLGAALVSIGIPDDSIIEYETQIKTGKFVVIAHDIQGKLDKAIIALEATRHQGIETHSLHA